jgi:hypothetical protein
MDVHGIYATATTISTNASKSALHAAWTWTALHPRTATVVGLTLILASGVIGFAIGVGA